MPHPITAADDYRHVPENETEWRESYYFNFVNHDNKTSGFTTIGILPNLKKAEFVLAFFFEDTQTVYFKETEIPTNDNTQEVPSDNTLVYRLAEPMQRWDISFSNKNLDLRMQWRSRFPPLDFGECSGTSWKGHFEQSGVMKGEARLPDGRRIPIDGYGQRDKSWGPRNWHIERWFAFHAQFKTYAIGLRRDTVKGIQHISGGYSSEKKQKSASNVDVEIIYDRDPKLPVGALTTIKYDDGEETRLSSVLVSPKSYVNFSRDFPNGSTQLFEGMAIHDCLTTGEKGTGLTEFLFTYPKP